MKHKPVNRLFSKNPETLGVLMADRTATGRRYYLKAISWTGKA